MKSFVALLVALAVLLGGARAHAAPRLRFQGDAPLVLHEVSGSWVGTVHVENAGDAPLVLARVYLRDAGVDPSLARVRVGFGTGPGHLDLAPGAHGTIELFWAPAKDDALRAVSGHVVVVSSDPDAHERAFGFRATRDRGALGWLTRHLLSLLVLSPTLGALALALLERRRSPRVLRAIALICSGVTAILGSGVARASSFDLGGAPALVTRAVLSRTLGLELHLGVDASSVPAITAVALLAPLAVLLVPRASAAVVTSSLLGIVATVLLALVSLDGVSFVFALSATAALVLVLAQASGASRAASLRFLAASVLGIAAFLLALSALRSAADPGLLADGTPVVAPWSSVELAHTAFLAKGTQFLGLATVTFAWVLFFVAAAIVGGLAPFHLGLFALAGDRRAPHVALVILAFVLRLGEVILARWAIPLLPEATRWAAPVVLPLAVLACVLHAFVALARPASNDSGLARAAFAAQAAGFAALATLTTQGFAAFAFVGPIAGGGVAIALASSGRFARFAHALVATGAGLGAALAIIAVAARSPSAAVVLAFALGVVAWSRSREPSPWRNPIVAGFATIATIVLVASTLGAVAFASRVATDRLGRAGGDVLGQ